MPSCEGCALRLNSCPFGKPVTGARRCNLYRSLKMPTSSYDLSGFFRSANGVTIEQVIAMLAEFFPDPANTRIYIEQVSSEVSRDETYEFDGFSGETRRTYSQRGSTARLRFSVVIDQTAMMTAVQSVVRRADEKITNAEKRKKVRGLIIPKDDEENES